MMHFERTAENTSRALHVKRECFTDQPPRKHLIYTLISGAHTFRRVERESKNKIPTQHALWSTRRFVAVSDVWLRRFDDSIILLSFAFAPRQLSLLPSNASRFIDLSIEPWGVFTVQSFVLFSFSFAFPCWTERNQHRSEQKLPRATTCH